MDANSLNDIRKCAVKVRRHIIEQVYSAKSGHPGGSLSCTDILCVLYFKQMKIKPEQPQWPDRDRFVLSKGHCAPALYAVLAERGFFPKEDLKNLRKIDSYLQGHPDMKAIPGVDMSTGSLGQGLSAANGMALAGKIDNKNYRVFVVMGDGEIQEGQIWEAAMTAVHYKLDNIIAFVDHNGLQIDGKITEVKSPEPIADKFNAFGWNVISIDGHDYNQIDDAINSAKNVKGIPTVIVAETIKGKGVSFMEGAADWHGNAPNEEQYNKALIELQNI